MARLGVPEPSLDDSKTVAAKRPTYVGVVVYSGRLVTVILKGCVSRSDSQLSQYIKL